MLKIFTEEIGISFLSLSQPLSKNHPLFGKSVLFTGTLQNFSREEAQKMVEEVGGKPVTALSSRTHFLVCGENAGSKKLKALKIGIPILLEDDFLKILGEKNIIKMPSEGSFNHEKPHSLQELSLFSEEF